MPKICYVDKNFNMSSWRIINVANQICTDYIKQGYVLTLRQLYYQFVARGHIANTMQEYKRIGSIINDARLAGPIDWNAIEDRTRNLESPSTWDSPKDILRACASQFKYDMWEHQPVRIEVWVEKEALVGVVERTAEKYRVPFFACRGYASQSELWRAGLRFKDYLENGQRVVVLHLGDHDPSGIDMTRDNADRLEMFAEERVRVKRLALNEDQVRQYNPPPNPAKLTDSRATGYIERFGSESWELDALEPSIIDGLVADAIESERDEDQWREDSSREDNARARIADVAAKWRD